jgi:hypothetical protein
VTITTVPPVQEVMPWEAPPPPPEPRIVVFHVEPMHATAAELQRWYACQLPGAGVVVQRARTPGQRSAGTNPPAPELAGNVVSLDDARAARSRDRHPSSGAT